MFRTSRVLDIVLIVMVLVLALLLWLPHPGGGHERARRTMCTSNLKQVLYACQLYAKGNADAFPPDLEALHPEYVSDCGAYVCRTAASAGHVPDKAKVADAFVPGRVCYAYVSGLRATDDPSFVVAFDEEWNHAREGVIAANICGMVTWTGDIDEFHAKLDEQRAALAAEGRSMEVIRPTWSRWPDPPDYPVRPWTMALVVIMALAGSGGAVAFVVRRRRAVRAASAGGSGGSPSGGC
ncbi:MAG: hypothetical protein ACYS9X_23150 [Planctomycetota bacterium]|jgi:hypothetical protein